MGTRGLFGFRKNKQDKLTYHHNDSYPRYLGNVMMKYIKTHTDEQMSKIYDEIKPNYNMKKIKEYTKEEYEEYKDILRGVSIKEDLKGVGPYDTLVEVLESELRSKHLDYYDNKKLINKVMPIDNDFIKDSLLCEWAYIINLDTNKLEIWKGFQKKPDKNNRYGTELTNEQFKYYPCALKVEIPFEDLRKDSIEDIRDFLIYGDDD